MEKTIQIMRKRYNKVNVFLNDDEKNILKRNCEIYHTNQSEYIRSLIIDYDMNKNVSKKAEDKSKEKGIDVAQVNRIINDSIEFLIKVKIDLDTLNITMMSKKLVKKLKI